MKILKIVGGIIMTLVCIYILWLIDYMYTSVQFIRENAVHVDMIYNDYKKDNCSLSRGNKYQNTVFNIDGVTKEVYDKDVYEVVLVCDSKYTRIAIKELK